MIWAIIDASVGALPCLPLLSGLLPFAALCSVQDQVRSPWGSSLILLMTLEEEDCPPTHEHTPPSIHP